MSADAVPSYAQYRDDQLLAALGRNDREAFAELYNRHWQPLFSLAVRKIQSRETAEEIVQDLFISVWTNRHECSILSLRPYLFSALRFAIIDYIRSQQVQDRFMAYYESFLQQTDTQPANELNLQDLTKAIEATLSLLPEKSGEIFRLSRFQQLTIPEIAAQLGLSEKAVEYHLTRALKVVRDNLRQTGVTFMLFLPLYYPI